MPGRDRSGAARPPSGSRTPSKSIVLDPDVVVEVLEVPQRRHRAAGVRVQRRRAVRGEWRASNASQSAPTRRKPVIPPQRVASACSTSTRPASSMRPEVRQVVAVLAGRDLHAGRRAVAHSRSPRDRRSETGSSNQVTPQLGETLGPRERLLARVGAVGVDEQLGLGADRLARGVERAADRRRDRGRSSSSRAGCPASAQPPSCCRSCSSEYDVKPPLP